jgi:predicted nucleic acid-binding protein
MPSAVRDELLAGGPKGIDSARLREATWLLVASFQDPRRADLLADLDRSEAEVIALAQERNADLGILDERLARRHARRVGLALTGTLGVLLRAKQVGLVVAVASLIDKLRLQGIWLSEAVVAGVLRLAGEA